MPLSLDPPGVPHCAVVSDQHTGRGLADCNLGSPDSSLAKAVRPWMQGLEGVHIKALVGGVYLLVFRCQAAAAALDATLSEAEGIDYRIVGMPTVHFVRHWNEKIYEWVLNNNGALTHASLSLAYNTNDAMCLCLQGRTCVVCKFKGV